MPLKAPAGMDTRPTQDRTKETLFNVLQNDVPGAMFLDLFAGSGSIGIEALSRGARGAVLVENAKGPIACIRDNLKFTRFENEAVVMETDVLSALERLRNHEEFDIIFMDPPYRMGIEPDVLRVLSKMPYVTEHTIIVIEAALDFDMGCIVDNGFVAYKVKQYKTNQHIIIKKS